MSSVPGEDEKATSLKKELDPSGDNTSSKMSIWAKASSVLNPLKSNIDNQEDKLDGIVEISESKLGSHSQKTDDEKKSLGDSTVSVKSNKNSKLNQQLLFVGLRAPVQEVQKRRCCLLYPSDLLK